MTPSPEAAGRVKCARRGEALAWLQGELPPDQAEDYCRHVGECVPCAEFVADAREMLVRLSDEAAAERSRSGTYGSAVATAARALSGIERRILQHCGPDLEVLQAQARSRTRRGAVAAAAVLMLVFSAHLGLRALRGDDVADAQGALAAAAVARADGEPAANADWIAERLGPDGRFDAATWRGPRAQEVGMHGLALLALARAAGELDAPDAELRSDEVLRGARWLLEQQDADGTVGAAGEEGGGFDHAVAAVALVEVAQLTQDAALLDGAERAIARLVATQLADGGWQPHARSRGSNPVRTAWALQALLCGEELGMSGLQTPIARGRVRLAADLGGSGATDELDLAAVARVALGTAAGGAACGAAPGAAARPTASETMTTVCPAAGSDGASDTTAGALVARAAPDGSGGNALGDLYAASCAVLAAMPVPR